MVFWLIPFSSDPISYYARFYPWQRKKQKICKTSKIVFQIDYQRKIPVQEVPFYHVLDMSGIHTFSPSKQFKVDKDSNFWRKWSDKKLSQILWARVSFSIVEQQRIRCRNSYLGEAIYQPLKLKLVSLKNAEFPKKHRLCNKIGASSGWLSPFKVPNSELGPNDHQEDAPQFQRQNFRIHYIHICIWNGKLKTRLMK